MSENQINLINPKSQDLSKSMILNDRPDLILPEDVKEFLLRLFSECNNRISLQLSTFPNAHEESLDLLFISHFAQMQGAIKFGSKWTLRFDAHFIGGGRHYRTWEVADIGLMVIFRKNGKITRSKLTFLQSKKLYANTLKYQPIDPYYRSGMGRLLVTDDEHRELIEPKLLKYSENSKYKALKMKSEQQEAMSSFSTRYNIKLQYLLYNPSLIPWEIKSPVEEIPVFEKNKVGCRVVSKKLLDKIINREKQNYSPSYKDIKELCENKLTDNDSKAGWRLENFINDLFIDGNEGLVDDSPNFETMINLLSQKSSPISSALSITFDIEE